MPESRLFDTVDLKSRQASMINELPRVPALKSSLESENCAGLYIHIPFCIRKCPYCDFYSITDGSLKTPFMDALSTEMALYTGLPFSFDSVHLGGGTPSVLIPREISRILENLRSNFHIKDGAEITLEANPGTVDSEKCLGYKKAGINRINIGVQSFFDGNLEFLGRIHSAEQSRTVIQAARKAGFSSLGIDLIYGLPGQSLADWQRELEIAVAHKFEHISCYKLTIESGTPLEKDLKQGLYLPPNETLCRTMFLFTIHFLEKHGYVQYEISNFARRGHRDAKEFRSRHNQKYWDFTPYLGLGPAAHSFLIWSRFWNHSSVVRYIRKLESGKLPVDGMETISREQQRMETVLLGLRKKEGIDIKSFREQFGQPLPEEIINGLERKGYLKISGNNCALTPEGMCFLDSICELLA